MSNFAAYYNYIRAHHVLFLSGVQALVLLALAFKRLDVIHYFV